MEIIAPQRVTLRELFRIPAFAVLFPAEVVSVLGSQLAKFALSVLVFDRTNSATAAALTYATSFLPSIIGGLALARLGDRFARRTVMITADTSRAVLFLAMAIPSMPLWAVIVLLVVAVVIEPAFTSAEVSFLADALAPERFRAATAVRATSNQMLQVIGFAIGGAVVVLIRPSGALVVDAASFVLSAALIAVALREPDRVHRSSPGPGVAPSARFAGLWRDDRTRIYMAFTVLVGLFVLPEALAVPFGAQIGASTVETGVLLSMIPLGGAVGALLIVRVQPGRRLGIARWMAVLCGLPLLASGWQPVWPVACVCWFVSGVLTAYQVEATTVLVRTIPQRDRARLIGVVSSWLVGSQGVGFAVGGVLAHFIGPGESIAWAAAGGCVAAVVVVVASVAGVRQTASAST